MPEAWLAKVSAAVTGQSSENVELLPRIAQME